MKVFLLQSLRLALSVLFVASCSSQSHNEGPSDAAVPGAGGARGHGGTGGSSVSGNGGAQGSGGAAKGSGGASGGTGGTPTGGSSRAETGGTSGSTAGAQATGGIGVAAGGAAGSTNGTGGSSGGAGGGLDAGISGTGGVASYNPCSASTGPCKILPLGDSITFGGGSAKVDGGTATFEGGYRVQLFTRAVTANQRITFVGSQSNGPTTVSGKPFPRNHEGHAGWVIDQIAGLIPSPALDSKPDIILLLIGTNDMYQGDVPAAPDRLAKLMDKILAADTHALLVVSAITPWAAQGSKIPTYNNAIPPLVAARAAAGKHIMFADVTVGWDSNTMFGDDKLHPSWPGYNLMGDLWYKAVGGLFPQ